MNRATLTTWFFNLHLTFELEYDDLTTSLRSVYTDEGGLPPEHIRLPPRLQRAVVESAAITKQEKRAKQAKPEELA